MESARHVSHSARDQPSTTVWCGENHSSESLDSTTEESLRPTAHENVRQTSDYPFLPSRRCLLHQECSGEQTTCDHLRRIQKSGRERWTPCQRYSEGQHDRALLVDAIHERAVVHTEHRRHSLRQTRERLQHGLPSVLTHLLSQDDTRCDQFATSHGHVVEYRWPSHRRARSHLAELPTLRCAETLVHYPSVFLLTSGRLHQRTEALLRDLLVVSVASSAQVSPSHAFVSS